MASREIRFADLIRPVCPNRSVACLLDPRIHSEGRTARDRRDTQQLPALCQNSAPLGKEREARGGISQCNRIAECPIHFALHDASITYALPGGRDYAAARLIP